MTKEQILKIKDNISEYGEEYQRHFKKEEMITIVSRFKPCRVSTFKGKKTVRSYEISRFWRLTLN